MRKKALFQDFKAEIKKSFSRFASILLIVALGTAFFSGIRATEPDMRISADSFYDKTNLMDVRVISTLGLTDDDVQAIERVNGVQAAEPFYSVDVLCTAKDTELAVRVMSLTEKVNKLYVHQGRLPDKPSECLVDRKFVQSTGYQIGDKIKLRSGTDEELSESLKEEELTIVGIGSSSYYLSLERGSTSIGSGSLHSFIVVPANAFNLSAYTEIAVLVDGAEELISYSDEYEERVKEVVQNIEKIADERRKARYEEILGEARKEIEKAKAELAEKEADVNAELEDAARQIEEAKKEIADAEKSLDDAKKELEDGKAALDENRQKLLEAEKELEDGRRALLDGEAEIAEGAKLLEEKYREYEEGALQIADAQKQWEASYREWEENKAVLDKMEQELNGALSELAERKRQLEPVKDLFPDEWQMLVQS